MLTDTGVLYERRHRKCDNREHCLARENCRAYQLESRADVTTLTTPDAAGSAYLTFTRSGTDTVLTRAFATSPAKLIASKGRGSTCWVYAATLRRRPCWRRRHSAARGRHSRRARAVDDTGLYQGISIGAPVAAKPDGTVGANALLAVVPDPIVCFAAADFAQQQRYDLHPDASLVMVDWMTSGRHAAGERWAFSRYESRFDIRRGSQRIFFDGLVLEPNTDSVVVANGPLRRVRRRQSSPGRSSPPPRRSSSARFHTRRSHVAPISSSPPQRFLTAARCCAWPARASKQMGHTLRAVSRFCRRSSATILEEKMVTSCI